MFGLTKGVIKNKKGFMLVEVLYTLTLTSIVTFTAGLLTLTVVNNFSESDSKYEMNSSISSTTLHLRNNINNSKGVNLESKKLTLTMPDGSKNTYELVGGEFGKLQYNGVNLLFVDETKSKFTHSGKLIKCELTTRFKRANSSKGDKDIVIAISLK